MVSVPHIPYIQRYGSTQQLVIDGKPFLMLGAELQNSSLSSAEYMSDVWPKMVATNINTVLGAVTWEVVEPEEGTFEFGELDKVILGAREHGIRLVLLWFGSWKNGVQRLLYRGRTRTNVA
jgi:beta-galactosidase GanA